MEASNKNRYPIHELERRTTRMRAIAVALLNINQFPQALHVSDSLKSYRPLFRSRLGGRIKGVVQPVEGVFARADRWCAEIEQQRRTIYYKGEWLVFSDVEPEGEYSTFSLRVACKAG